MREDMAQHANKYVQSDDHVLKQQESFHFYSKRSRNTAEIKVDIQNISLYWQQMQQH